MFGLIKKIFIRLLTGLVNEYNHTNCVSLSDQKCELIYILMNRATNFTTIHFRIDGFFKLDRWVGSYNTLNDLSNKVCIPNKTEDLILSVSISCHKIKRNPY